MGRYCLLACVCEWRVDLTKNLDVILHIFLVEKGEKHLLEFSIVGFALNVSSVVFIVWFCFSYLQLCFSSFIFRVQDSTLLRLPPRALSC